MVLSHQFTHLCTICKKVLFSFPVGPAPASADHHSLPPLTQRGPPQSVPQPGTVPLLTDTQSSTYLLIANLQSLLEQYVNLCNLLRIIQHPEEEELAVTCLSTIQSSIQMLQTQLSLAGQLQQHTEKHLPSVSRFTNIIQLHTQLWHQLFFPHITKVCCIS